MRARPLHDHAYALPRAMRTRVLHARLDGQLMRAWLRDVLARLGEQAHKNTRYL